MEGGHDWAHVLLSTTRSAADVKQKELKERYAKIHKMFRLLEFIPATEIVRLAENSDEWLDRFMEMSREGIDTQRQILRSLEDNIETVDDMLDSTPLDVWESIEDSISQKIQNQEYFSDLVSVPPEAPTGALASAAKTTQSGAQTKQESPSKASALAANKPSMEEIEAHYAEQLQIAMENWEEQWQDWGYYDENGEFVYYTAQQLAEFDNILPVELESEKDVGQKYQKRMSCLNMISTPPPKKPLPSVPLTPAKTNADLLGRFEKQLSPKEPEKKTPDTQKQLAQETAALRNLKETVGELGAATPKQKKRKSVRRYLVYIFTVMMTLGMGSITGMWYRSAQSTVYNLVEDQMLVEMNSRNIFTMENYMNQTDTLCDILIPNFTMGDLGLEDIYDSPANEYQLDTYIINLKLSFPTVSMIFIGTGASGDPSIVGVTNDLALKSRNYKPDCSSEGPHYCCYTAYGIVENENGRQHRAPYDNKTSPNCSYFPNLRSWYQSATTFNSRVWTPIYVFTSGGLGTTYACPVPDTPGSSSFSAVVGIDIALARLSEVLQSTVLPSDESSSESDAMTTTFILELGGLDQVVATSDVNQTLAFENPDGTKERLVGTAEDRLNTMPAVSFATEELKRRDYDAAFSEAMNSGAEDFMIAGTTRERSNLYMTAQLMSNIDTTTNRTLEWVLVTIIPRDGFITVLLDRLRLSMSIAVLFLVLAVLTVSAVSAVMKNKRKKLEAADDPSDPDLPKKKRKRKRWSRVALIILFILLLLFSFSFVWIVWFLSAENTSKSLISNDVMPQVTNRIVDSIITYLDAAKTMVNLVAPFVETTLFDIENLPGATHSLDKFLSFNIMAKPQRVQYVYIGTEKEYFIGAKLATVDGKVNGTIIGARDPTTAETAFDSGKGYTCQEGIALASEDAFTDGVCYNKYWADDSFARTDHLVTGSVNPTYQPTQRAWYKSAKVLAQNGDGNLTWTNPYTFSSGGLGISLAKPLFRHKVVSIPNYLGAIAIDMGLQFLGDTLSQIRVGNDGQLFVIARGLSRDDVTYSAILASKSVSPDPPSVDCALLKEGISEEARLSSRMSDFIINARDFIEGKYDNCWSGFRPLSYLADALDHLEENFAGAIYSDMLFDGYDTFFSGSRVGSELILNVETIGDAGLDWMLVVIIPRSDMLSRMDNARDLSIVLGVIILVTAVTVVNVVAWILSGKKKKMRERSNRQQTGLVRRVSSFRMKSGELPAELDDSQRQRLALLYVEDARRGRQYCLHRGDRAYEIAYRFLTNSWYRHIIDAWVVVHAGIVPWEIQDIAPGSDAHTVLKVIDLTICGFYIVDLSLQMYISKPLKFLRNPDGAFQCFLVFFMFLDACLHSVGLSNVRFSRPVRLVMLILQSQKLRRLVVLLVSTLPALFDVLILLSSVMFVMGIIGVILFRGKYIREEQELVHENFDNIHHAALSLYVLLSADNYPAVMLPALSSDGNFPAFYFIFWLIIGMVGFVSLIVVKFNTAYKNHRNAEILRERVRQRKCLVSAFNLLDADGSQSIDLKEFSSLFDSQKNVPRADVEKKYREVDTDNSGFIDMWEFFDLCDVLIIKYEVNYDIVNPKRHNLMSRRLVLSEWFHWWMLFVCVFHVGILALYGVTESLFVLDFLCWMFFICYCVELSLKVVGWGWRKYWYESAFNKFDMMVVLLSVVGSIMNFTVFKNVNYSTTYWRFFFVIPALRAITVVRRTKKLVGTIFLIIPPFANIMLIFMVISYFYICIGVEFFQNKFEHVDDMDVKTKLNFNDFGSSVRVMIQLFSAAAWNDVMWAAMQTTNSFAALYFVSYQFVCVLIVNLFVGLVIDSFSRQIRDATNAQAAKQEDKGPARDPVSGRTW